jgi:hypothetical protein
VTATQKSSLRVLEKPEPYPKCSLLLRGGARFFDLAMAWGIWEVGQRVGAVGALLFLLFADGLLLGQSFGKRLFGVKVVHLPTRAPARYRESILRNAPFGLVVVLGMMPAPLGFAGFLGGVVVIGGIEFWKVYRDPLGIRLGDVWAQTQVVDGKVMADASATLSPRIPARAAGKMLEQHRRRST